ncbi:uncharacterized protein TA20780 [Theileria annulata]|uniref:Transcription factor IIIC subunit 5 HTH domain-containing protein n=1 Tax=Theileria annulata TaxID=5874 RepID=Q4UH01_THEAN|nr:uncharacterized protein TA20780 [Theileria annulata]CAI73638.1 hypothetical protein TA20780 [Theileria annulata]|eukprot:XP_954315.1 hypothetical protein TA20780 [Theileria annulata]
MKFVVVAVPGVISPDSNGDEILRAIGGKEGLRSVLNGEKSEQLILRFGIDSTSSFVPANTYEDNIPCKLVAKAKLWKSGKCTIDLLGPVVDYFSFSHPSDFLHLSLQPVVAGELVGEKLVSNVPNIPPPIFTKIDMIDQLFNKSLSSGSTSSTSQKVKKYSSGSIFSSVARFEDVNVPLTPLNLALPSPDPTLMSYLENLFNKRKLWLRSALDEFLPTGYSNWKKRTSFSRICYIFSDGPWRGCMCKLGYDPRKDRNSRFYQTIDFRDPHYRTISWKTGRRSLSNSENLGQELNIDKEKTYGELSNEVITPNPEVHFLIPSNRPSQLYQLCDICDAGIQNIVNSTDFSAGILNNECSKATGKQLEAKIYLKAGILRPLSRK